MTDPTDITGDKVYRSLMDLDLTLADISKMGPLRIFLGTVASGNPALVKLHTEIQAFTARLDGLIEAAKIK